MASKQLGDPREEKVPEREGKIAHQQEAQLQLHKPERESKHMVNAIKNWKEKDGIWGALR